MDISAGTRQNEQAADFPLGVPAVSDASMSAWMEYVYMQKPEPTSVTGVTVAVSVTDSNGNTRVIGTTTTDKSGTYALNWAPDVPGNYTVNAVFAGTGSYWGSSAEAHFYANTPTVTSTITPQPVSMASTQNTIMAGVVVVVIVIAIGFAVTILTLRKRA